MAAADLFPRDQIVGVFRGFQEGGLEFHADLVLPYQSRFQSIPMHGHFVLVQLETPQEAVLGRIASFSSAGKLTSESGEEFNLRALREGRTVPEDLREQYLRYRVNIRVLGVLRAGEDGRILFVPSQRRLPHLGSPVAFPSPEVLREIAGHTDDAGTVIGHLGLGEYVYAQGATHFRPEPWMQVKEPEVQVRFHIDSLVSRRSFIFARAGFGKSNLTKLLFSTLYRETPTVEKRGSRRVPVGTVIFDPDGEYFWPDDKGRPGLCDVPWLQDKLVVFTPRQGPSPYYQSFVAGGIKLDIRRLPASDVVGIALDAERQQQQNVRKLRALSAKRWHEMVDLVFQHGYDTPFEQFCKLLGVDPSQQQVEGIAALSNMNTIVQMVHDPRHRTLDMLLRALEEGKLCVFDLSQVRRGHALVLSALILKAIFDHNQREFTQATPRTIPTIAVIEEAQAVLNERSPAADAYIAWVKEGRKYDLGAVLVTQQPGSIPTDILSQGDNWFIFHLLSAADLASAQRANAHFSDDLLSALLNEPIPGQGIVWSSAGGKPYPLPVRVLSFEQMIEVQDKRYALPARETAATGLRALFDKELEPVTITAEHGVAGEFPVSEPVSRNGPQPDTDDYLTKHQRRAIAALREDQEFMAKMRQEGYPWGGVKALLRNHLPETLHDRDQVAYRLVSDALTEIFGAQNVGWHAFKHPKTEKIWVKAGRKEGGN